MTATLAFQGVFLWLTAAAGVAGFMALRVLFRAVLDRHDDLCDRWERERRALGERCEIR